MTEEWMAQKIRGADVKFAEMLGLDPSVVLEGSLLVDIYGRTARWSEMTPDGPVRRGRDVTSAEITAMVEQGMHDLDGWQRVTCEVAEVIRHANAVRVFSSLTDPDGLYGHPVIYTEWGIPELSDGDVPLLREYQWWSHDPSRRCEHYVPIPT